jgi:hypothetical protein
MVGQKAYKHLFKRNLGGDDIAVDKRSKAITLFSKTLLVFGKQTLLREANTRIEISKSRLKTMIHVHFC